MIRRSFLKMCAAVSCLAFVPSTGRKNKSREVYNHKDGFFEFDTHGHWSGDVVVERKENGRWKPYRKFHGDNDRNCGFFSREEGFYRVNSDTKGTFASLIVCNGILHQM